MDKKNLTYFAFIFLIIYLSSIFNSNIYNYFVVLIISIIMFLIDIKSSVLFLISFIPFHFYFSELIIDVSIMSIFEFIVILKFFLKKEYSFSLNDLVVLSIIITFQIIGPVIFYSMSLVSLINLISNLLILIIFIKISTNESFSFFKKGFYLFTYSLIFSIFMSFFTNKSILLLESWERYSGLLNDPNFFGMFLTLSISFCFINIFYNNLNKINVLSNILLIIVMLVFGVLTYSRTFVIILGLLLLYYFIFVLILDRKVSLKKFNMRMIMFFTFLLVFIVVFIFINNARGIFDVNSLDWTNGRFISSINVVVASIKNPISLIFGFGYNNLISVNLGIVNVPHNTLVDIFSNMGIIIGIVSLFLFYKLVKNSKINIIRNPYFIIYIALILYSFSLSLITNDFLYMFIGLLPSIGNKMGIYYV